MDEELKEILGQIRDEVSAASSEMLSYLPSLEDISRKLGDVIDAVHAVEKAVRRLER